MRAQRLFLPLALAAALAAGSTAASAQTLGLNWNPRTGDVWVDTQLADINRYGSSYRDPFIDEMVRYHGAPRDLVTNLLVNQRWSAGDVYYACTIAQVIGRPCAYVADQWEANRGQGWGVVAQRLGIKPGSAEFHRLKKGFVPTYDRWSRPITLDAELQRAYPQRAKGPGKVTKSGGKHTVAVKAKSSSSAAPTTKTKGPPATKGQQSGNSGKGGGKSNGQGQGQGKGNGKP